MPANRMPLPPLRVHVAALLLLCAVPLQAQHDDRIWGRVFTEGGEVHEGFIRPLRWQAAASWADLLLASKEIPDEHYRDWLDATRGGEPHVGTVELKGYRITWEQKHPSFERAHLSGIRFGHLSELTIEEDGKVRLVTRSHHGAEVERADTATIGRDSFEVPDGVRAVADSADGFITVQRLTNMELRIENGDRSINVNGSDVARIEFGTAPPGSAAPSSPRLYGTLEDRTGRSFTGFVNWDRGSVLESHRLGDYWEDVPELANPWVSDEYEHSFRFSEVRSLQRTPCFAKATLKSDSVIELCSEPFERDPMPVRISDPALGRVEVDWDAVRTLRFEPSPGLPGYDAFDGGRPLSGTVVTQDGEEITGRIRWDADEEWSWELLQGSSDDVEFSIEFGNIAHIEREESEGARVTLHDGRSFHLTSGNDIDHDNRGIFIFPVTAGGAADGGRTDGAAAGQADGAAAGQTEPEWRYVAWEDFREVRFHPTDDKGAGS